MINNLNQITELTQAKGEVYFYSLLILWLSFIITHPILTAMFKSSNTNWGKYWLVYGFTVVISGVLFMFLISSPEQVLVLIDKIKELFA